MADIKTAWKEFVAIYIEERKDRLAFLASYLIAIRENQNLVLLASGGMVAMSVAFLSSGHLTADAVSHFHWSCLAGVWSFYLVCLDALAFPELPDNTKFSFLLSASFGAFAVIIGLVIGSASFTSGVLLVGELAQQPGGSLSNEPAAIEFYFLSRDIDQP